MRILILAPQPFFQPRGTPIAVRMLAESLAEAGHEVNLLAFHEGESVPMAGVTLHRIVSPPFVRNIGPGFSLKKLVCDIAMALKAMRMALNGQYDIIHAVEEASFIARGWRWLTGTPYIFDMDSSMPQQLADSLRAIRPFQPFMEALEAWAIRGSAATVVMCKALEDRVHEVSPDTPVLRLEDVSMLNDTDVEEDLRTIHSITGPLIMYVGNLEPYQGVNLLIDAFQWVYESNEEARLVIIGGSNHHIDQYGRAVAEGGLSRHVHFVGPRPLKHLGAYLRQADILVSPRIQGKNTPMKIYSYLDSGRPVVATRKKTHTQVLDDDIAMLADPTPNAMAEAMLRLIQDEDLGNRIASNARKRVADEYSPEAFRRKLTAFYESIECDVLSLDKSHKESLENTVR